MVEKLKLDEPVTSIVEIESHVVSTRCASLYRALLREDGSSVSIWESRARITPELENEFLSRLDQIARLKLPNCPIRAYGVDSEERGFAIMGEIEANFILSGASSKVDLREAERRYSPCLQIVSRLHQAGIVAGDLCNHSFVLDRSGKVLFVGVIGDSAVQSYQEDLSAEIDSIPPEIFQYMSPEQRAGQIATQQSDVFALGVLGYRLFSGQYPFGKIPKEQLIGIFDFPEQLPEIIVNKNNGITSVPSWCNEVFQRAVHKSPLIRFANSDQLISEISALRQKAINEAELPADHRAALEAPSKYAKQAEGAQKFVSPKVDGKKNDDTVSEIDSSRIKFKIVMAIAALVAVSLGLFIATSFFSGKENSLSSGQKIAKQPELQIKSNNYQHSLKLLAEGLDGVAAKETALAFASEELDLKKANELILTLMKSGDALANKIIVLTAVEYPDLEISKSVQKLILANYSKAGFTRSSELIADWINQHRNADPEVLDALLAFANPGLEITERESLLRRAYQVDAAIVVSLTAATALDSGKPAEYQPILSQIIGDVLREKNSSDYSAIALMLAEPKVTSQYSEDLLLYKDQLQDNDLLWLIKILSIREDPKLRSIAEIALDRLKLQGWRQEFLQILSQKEDLTQGVVLALINSATSEPSVDDVGQLASWVDPLSNQALMAICAESHEPEVIIKAFDTLAAKALPDNNVSQLIQLIRNKYWEQRAQLAILVPAVAGTPELNAELNPRALDILAEYSKNVQLMKIVFQTSNTTLLNSIMERYGVNLDLTVLLDLLSSPSKELRMKAISALKGYNDAISLNMIAAKFKKEKDPEVIQHYKNTFWTIAERFS